MKRLRMMRYWIRSKGRIRGRIRHTMMILWRTWMMKRWWRR
jgi:hypothetical protein